jgi:RluA family pseudouridine synthase
MKLDKSIVGQLNTLLDFHGKLNYQHLIHENMRLDLFLSSLTRRVSRAFWVKAIASKKIFVNGAPVAKKSYKLHYGDEVQFDFYALCRDLLDEELSFSTDYGIIYENEHYIIVDKPSGVLIHRIGFVDHSLISQMEHDYGFSLYPVHRLDKHTSGLCMVAKSSRSTDGLQALIRNHQIQKYYLVASEEQLVSNSGLFEIPIADDDSGIHSKKQKVDLEGGLYCKTRYRKIGESQGIHYYMVRIFTGRQHQIRVHFQYGGAPVMNDELYSYEDYSHLPPMYDFDETNLGLHAFRLRFFCPFEKEMKCFTSLPDRIPFVELREDVLHGS